MIEIPEFPYPGGHSQGFYWRGAADRLDGNHPVGGSNVRQTLATLCRRVADQLENPSPQWRRFRQGDPSTWPSKNGLQCWIWASHFAMPINVLWVALDAPHEIWQPATHWMEIAVPEPPVWEPEGVA